MGVKKSLGDFILEHLQDQYHFETDGWARERVDRVSELLQGPDPIFEIHIPWMEDFTAFTAPGRHIFLSRRVLEQCRTDEPAAMIVAHEMAHHELGHVRHLPDWLHELAGSETAVLLSMLRRSLFRRFHGAERERDADLHGLDLCLAAGYDGEACIGALDILERYALDHRALDAVYGAEEPDPLISDRFSHWLNEKLRSHPPLRERKAEMRRHWKSRLLGGPTWKEELAARKAESKETDPLGELRPVAVALGSAVQSTSVGASLGRLGSSTAALLRSAKLARKPSR